MRARIFRLFLAVLLALIVCVGCSSAAPTPAPAPAPAVPPGYPPGLHHYDMPEGFPAVWTFCEGKTRFGVTYKEYGGDHGTPVLSIAAAQDDSCLK